MGNLMRGFFVMMGFVMFVSSAAAAATYDMDTAHSSVNFKIKHMLSNTKGSFLKFSGVIELNEDQIAGSTATAKIETASIDTHEPKRDEHLKSPDFFDAVQFPEISFSGTVSADGQKLVGPLTMHGVTKEVSLDLVSYGTIQDPWGKTRAAFSATGALDRKDFGITYNKTLDQGGLMIGETVQIEIEVEAIKRQAEQV